MGTHGIVRDLDYVKAPLGTYFKRCCKRFTALLWVYLSVSARLTGKSATLFTTEPMNRQQSFLPSLAPVKSTSRCADVVVPYLKKLSIGDDLAVRHQQKPPLITLKLSSTSFLNAVVNESHHYGPLYAIKTVGPATAILRRDPWQGSCKVADLRWPKHAPTRGKDKFVWQGALLKTVDGHWMATESLLKPAGIFKYVIITCIRVYSSFYTFLQYSEI